MSCSEHAPIGGRTGRGSGWRARASLQKIARIARRGIGRRHVQDRLDEARHVDHRLAVTLVRVGVAPGVPRDLAVGRVVIVNPPEIVSAGQGVNVPSSGRIFNP